MNINPMLSCFTLPVSIKIAQTFHADADKVCYYNLSFNGSLCVAGYGTNMSLYARYSLHHLLREHGYNVFYVGRNNYLPEVVNYINFEYFKDRDTVLIADVMFDSSDTISFLEELTKRVINPNRFAIITTHLCRNVVQLPSYAVDKALYVAEDRTVRPLRWVYLDKARNGLTLIEENRKDETFAETTPDLAYCLYSPIHRSFEEAEYLKADSTYY